MRSQSRQVKANGSFHRGKTYTTGDPFRGDPTQRYPGMTEAIKAVRQHRKTVTHGHTRYSDDEWATLLQQDPG